MSMHLIEQASFKAWSILGDWHYQGLEPEIQ